MSGAERLWCERGGRASGPLLVLLHGLGCNAAVWDGLKPKIASGWPGRWLALDFRGHGRSFHGAPYGLGIHAADVAALIDPQDEVVLLGHSMGGIVAVILASGLFGIKVRRAIAFNVKMDWSDEDFAKGQALAQAAPKLFDSQDEAIERYLKVSGLKGLVDPASPAAVLGVRAEGGKFRLAVDPRANGLGKSDFAALGKAAQAPLTLLCSEKDPMATPEGMARLGAPVRRLAGLGHNVHVEAPDAFWRAIEGDLGDA
ncbi:MAG: alpha/beta hydrolase [Rhodospirillales bacterium]|nr:alpha/beta hydrolase [Rhodospirillales bacterium]